MDAVATWFPVVVLAAALGFWAYCVVDFAATPEAQIRSLSRPLWLVILIFGSVVGAMAWWTLGRPQPTGRR